LPRYFIDFHDGDHVIVDKQGSEWPTLMQARDEAVQALPDITKVPLPDGEHRRFMMTIRTEGGILLYRATLSFEGEHFAT